MISISIGSVDSETAYTCEVKTGKEALAFLNKYDHEGSSVCLRIAAWNGEAYKFLTTKIIQEDTDAYYDRQNC